MKYKSILLAFLFIGVLLIMVEVISSNKKQCTNEKVVYRYIPRTFEEEQSSPTPVSEIFETMFSQPSPWINSITENDKRFKEKINEYYISQA